MEMGNGAWEMNYLPFPLFPFYRFRFIPFSRTSRGGWRVRVFRKKISLRRLANYSKYFYLSVRGLKRNLFNGPAFPGIKKQDFVLDSLHPNGDIPPFCKGSKTKSF